MRIGHMNAEPLKIDLETLFAGEEVNDMILKAVIGLKTDQENPRFTFADPRLYGDFVEANKQGKEHGWPQPFNIDSETRQSILMPIHHTKPLHWSLVRIDVDEDEIYVMDSSRFQLKKRAEPTVQNLRKMLIHRDHDHRWKMIIQETPVQPNHWDCGIHVLANLIATVWDQPLPVSINGSELRARLARQTVRAIWLS